MVERDLSLAAYEGRPVHLMHLSARESVAALAPRARGGRRASSAEVDARTISSSPTSRPLARHEREDEPAAAHGGRPRGARRGAPRRHDLLHRDRPRAARAPREGRAVRGGAVRRHRARDGVRGAPHAPRRARASSRSRRCSSGMSAGPARAFGLPEPRIEVGERANLVAARPRRGVDGARRTASARSRRTRGSSARRSRGAVVKTVADGRVVFAA